MPNTFSLLIVTLVFFAPAAERVGSAKASATISDEVPVNPQNLMMTEDFPAPADAENPATSAAPSAGDVGIAAILLIETKSASISPGSPCDNKLCKLPMIYKAEGSEPPKTPATPAAPSAGVFFPHRKLMIAAVESNSTESPGY